MKAMKKILAYTLAAVVALSSLQGASAATQSPTTSNVQPVTREDVKTSTGAKVDVKKDGTAIFSAVKSTSATSIAVPEKVVVNGVKYTVTTIDAMAFAKAKKTTKLTLPASIKKISAGAFFGVKKLKTVVLKGKKSIKVEKDAFIGLNTKKLTIKVNKNMSKKELNKLKKVLKKAGFKGKVKKLQ